MPNPSWVTQENIKFDGTLTDVAVFKNAAGIRTVTQWNNLTGPDQALLTAVVDDFGGTVPLAAPTAGKQKVVLSGTVVGGTATGLNTAAATAGKVTIDLGSAKVGGDPSGLSGATGTAGFGTINYQPGVSSGDSLGITAPTAGSQTVDFGGLLTGGAATNLVPTAGSQTVDFGGLLTGGAATDLVGGTTYTATVTVDGVAIPVSILGSTASTVTDLITELNTDLGVAATAALVGGNIRITSATTGPASTVAITAGTLFAAPLASFVDIDTAVAGAGLATYTATVTVDGVAVPVSIAAASATTVTDLIAELNTDLGSAATAALVGGNIRITSATYGSASTVAIAAGTLFAAPLASFVDINTAVAGGGITSYTMTVKVDAGAVHTVTLNPLVTTTFGGLVTLINTAIGAEGTAAISGGDIRVTSATQGYNSKVRITAGTLLPVTTGYLGILFPNDGGGATRQYSATVHIDRTTLKKISFSGIDGATIQDVLDEINTDLGADATASLSGGDIVITSATTGANSQVRVSDSGFLFGSLTGFAGFSYTDGTPATTYTAVVTIDGVAKNVSVAGASASTYTDLLSEINTDLGAAGTAALANNVITITSATTGLSSKVRVSSDNLFRFLPAFSRIAAPLDGATDFTEVMGRPLLATGARLVDVIPVTVVGTKPVVLPNTPHTTDYVYYDGTTWKYLDDDTNVGGAGGGGAYTPTTDFVF